MLVFFVFFLDLATSCLSWPCLVGGLHLVWGSCGFALDMMGFMGLYVMGVGDHFFWNFHQKHSGFLVMVWLSPCHAAPWPHAGSMAHAISKVRSHHRFHNWVWSVACYWCGAGGATQDTILYAKICWGVLHVHWCVHPNAWSMLLSCLFYHNGHKPTDHNPSCFSRSPHTWPAKCMLLSSKLFCV